MMHGRNNGKKLMAVSNSLLEGEGGVGRAGEAAISAEVARAGAGAGQAQGCGSSSLAGAGTTAAVAAQQ
jgi:hypothetical protein